MSLSLKDDILKAVHDSQAQKDHNKLIRLQEELNTGKLVRVVNAQWKRTPISSTLYCSACDKIPESQLETKYCPECGAKMLMH